MGKYHVITFGCQMNRSDSERIVAILEAFGFVKARSAEVATILVVNACSVRQSGIDRIWGMLKGWQKRRQKEKLVTILTGCLLPQDIKRMGKSFDFVFNIKEIHKLKQFLINSSAARSCGTIYQKGHHQPCAGDFVESSGNNNYLDVIPKYANNFHASVPIMTGCNNFCSYCVVPYTRAGETSRSVKSVLTEIGKLAQAGYKEVALLGQNVNAYSPSDLKNFSANNPFKQNFARLLYEINQIEGIERITFESAHPKDMTDEVIAAIGLPKMMNYVHFALQSGDDQILALMNRKYTTESFYEIIKKLRKVRSNIAIGTDIIVGFPGETREQFENTLKFYKKVKFDISFNAQFSPRVGTKAAEMADDVLPKEKKRRWEEIHVLMEKITLEKNQKYVGKFVRVLIDKITKDWCEGNSDEMKRVRIYNRKHKLGDLVKVKIKKSLAWMLEA